MNSKKLFKKAADLIGITLLWLVGCVPVVTIVSSTAAMYETVLRCVRKESGGICKTFKTAYVKNLKQGVGLTILYGVAFALLGVGNYFVFGVNPDKSSEMMLLTISTLFISVLVTLTLLWLAPVLSRKTDTVGKLMKSAYELMKKNLVKSLLMLWIAFAVLLAIRLFLSLAVILPAAGTLCITYLSEKSLDELEAASAPKSEQPVGRTLSKKSRSARGKIK